MLLRKFLLPFFTFIAICFQSILIAETDAALYYEFCKTAANDDAIFNVFKRNPTYQIFQEHLTFQQGLDYLNVILKEYPDLVKYFDACRQNDLLGSPHIYDYGQYGYFSPSTLRYIKIAGDLRKEFGDLSQMDIVEIDTGYGGQCAILSYITGFASYTLIDNPDCHALARKNLSFHGLYNVIITDIKHFSKEKKYDLVISNFGFSDYKKEEQHHFLKNLIKPSLNGYMTCHFFSKDSFSADEITRILYRHGKTGKVETEHPLTSPENLLFTWKSPDNELSKLQPAKPTPLNPTSWFQTQNAITYSFSYGGRLGDNLLAYLHALWVSYKYGLPLLNTPFDYAEQYSLIDRHPRKDNYYFHKVITIKDISEVHSIPASTLFVIPFFPESKCDFDIIDQSHLPNYKVGWDNPHFRKEILESLRLKQTPVPLLLPNDCKTVAIHVRRGGGFDRDTINRFFVEKFPPDRFFINQIQRIARIYQGQKLYVHLFTDDRDPQSILNTYSKALNNPSITLGCRTTSNNPYSNVVEDMLAMTQFDCLIRGESYYSLISSIMGRHDYVITMTKGHWEGDEQMVDRVELTFRPPSK